MDTIGKNIDLRFYKILHVLVHLILIVLVSLELFHSLSTRKANDDQITLVLHKHEEVAKQKWIGANGSVKRRVLDDVDHYIQCVNLTELVKHIVQKSK